MLFGNNREQMRRTFLDAWRKYCAGQPLEALEAQVADVIAEHPEYHALMQDEEQALSREYLPEGGVENPFLHLSMHLGIREQVSTRRPAGIERIHAALSRRLNSTLEAEHRMMECLGKAMWQAQRSGTPPDEQAYLICLKQLLPRRR